MGTNDGRGLDDTAGTADDDYHLAAFSPCIDAAFWGADTPEADFDGNSRYDDLGVPNGPDAGDPPKDIGAFERQADSNPPFTLTATVQLEAYAADPGDTLTLRFTFSDGLGAPLATRSVPVAFTAGSDTETVVLTDTPPDTAFVSCKGTGHFLCRRVPVGGTLPDLTAAFTGPNQLLGGDLNDDNFIELRDFAQFLRDFGRPDCPHSDINGDGDVDNVEFGYIGLHFFTAGDPE